MKKRIIIVEDDPSILQVIRKFLESSGYDVQTCQDGKAGLNLITQSPPDIIVLDWDLPGLNGALITRALRSDPRTHKIPILMISAFSQMPNKLNAYECGISDFLPKPFEKRELLYRAQALMGLVSEVGSQTKIIKIDKLEINQSTHSIKIKNKEIRLRLKEFQMLWFFASQFNKVVSMKRIKEELWDEEWETSDNAVFCCISRIREQLGPNSKFQIESVKSIGYRLISLPNK